MNNKNMLIKGTTGILSVSLMVMSTIPSYAASVSSEKEEVVYCMMDASGNVKDAEVVNIFKGGEVVDYGDYSSVKMLTTNDQIKQNQDQITFSTKADQVYYQGTLKDTTMPWLVEINYTLDGKSISPSNLAGQSGNLKIHLKISENQSNDFYNNYALQATVTLDTNLCQNIICDGGTIANVGSDKQITYTILPGKGIDTEIQTDVKDFEMESITINGIKMNLNIDIDDKELMSEVNKVIDATKKINDGSTSLSQGTQTLKDGTSALAKGSTSLENGAKSLNGGVTSLNTGVQQMQVGLTALNSQSENLNKGSTEVLQALETIQTSLNAVSMSSEQLNQFVTSSAAINQGIHDLESGVSQLETNLSYAAYKGLMKQNGIDIDELKKTNETTIASLTQQVNTLQTTLSQIENVPGYETQVQELKAQITNLQNIIQLLNGNMATMSGTETYINTMNSYAKQLHTGILELQTKYEQFHQAIETLASSLNELAVNMTTLKTGIQTLTTHYKELNQGIYDYTDGVAKIVAGYQQIVEGTNALADGSQSLVDGSSQFVEKMNDFSSGVDSLNAGASSLNQGTQEFYNQAKTMDKQVENQIQDVLDSIQGNDSKTKSFVSSKNTKVESVQFVMKTDDIHKEEKEVKKTETQELNFWQKLLKLFGID